MCDVLQVLVARQLNNVCRWKVLVYHGLHHCFPSAVAGAFSNQALFERDSSLFKLITAR